MSDALGLVVLKGVAAGVMLAAPIGAVAVMCIRCAVSDHPWHTMMVGLGSAVVDALFGAIAALGISAIGSFVVEHEIGLALLGGGIVTAAGVLTYRAPIGSVAATSEAAGAWYFGRAFVLSIVNPATFLGALGIFAVLGGVDPRAAPAAAAALVASVFAGSLGWWLFLSLIARRFREAFLSKALPHLNHVEGIAIAAFGIGAVVLAAGRLVAAS
jgi:threonine/homoserine/homoserine lactone efflux protein